MTITKKRRQRCGNHKATGRSWDNYIFGFINYRGIEIWRCKECKQKDDEWLSKHLLREKKEQEERAERWKKFFIEQEIKETALKQKKRDELWDCVIKDYLALGTNLKGSLRNKFKESIPKEILQLTRATLKLNKLIKNIEKQIKNEEDQRILEEKKAKLPLITCKYHGNLWLKDCVKSGKKMDGTQKFKCKLCQKNLQKNHYHANKEKVLQAHAKYRLTRKINGKNKINEGFERKSIESI